MTVSAIVAVFAGGTIGFHHLLHEPWHSAFYRSVVTATLTGLDTTPRGPGAEFLTILLALAGVAIFGYLAAHAVEAVAREVTSDARKEKRRRRMIEELRDHFIICGYGRVGRRAAEEFAASGQPFVVLDFSEDALEAARERDVLYLEGRGAEDEDLTRAGIDRAKGLLASADSDAENVYITLSARARRPDLTIVARASDAEAERKLELAGADRVVQPYSSAGTEMAKLALKPQVAAFLELVSSHAGPDLRFEEIEVRSESGPRRPVDPRPADPQHDRRRDRRAAQARRHLRHDAEPRRAVRGRRRPDRDRHRAGADRRSRTCSRRRALAHNAVDRLAQAIGELIGCEVELERPKDPAHGDYATNVALPARERARPAAARVRAGARGEGRRAARGRARRGGGAGLRQPLARRPVLRRGARRDRRGLRRRLGRPRRSGSRSRWSPRTRPGRSPSPRRGTAPTATASRACSSSPATTSSASTTTTTPAPRWTASAPRSRRCAAARSRPEDGYQGDYIAELAREEGDPVPRMLERIEATMERFRDPLRLVGQAERPRARAAGDPRRAPDLRAGRRGLRPLDRLRRRQGPRARPLGREGRPADLRGRRRRLPPRQARARLRPRDLRARRRPPRRRRLVRGDRADARLRPGPDRGAALPARPSDPRRRADEDVEAPRRRRLPRRLHRRGRRRRRALVPRQPRPRPDDRDRHRPRRREEREEPGLLRPVRARPHRRHPPQRARPAE